MNNYTYNNIESSRREYDALPSSEWRKDYFNEENGGYVATHVLKTPDDMSIPGIAAEAWACYELAHLGKHVLRLPENIPELIDEIIIDNRPYRSLLKHKPHETTPRGYPDAYFDGQTWDFKISKSKKEDTLRQLIKDGRKADNIIFITTDNRFISRIQHALEREIGRRRTDNSWMELPNIYCFMENRIVSVWDKKNRQI